MHDHSKEQVYEQKSTEIECMTSSSLVEMASSEPLFFSFIFPYD